MSALICGTACLAILLQLVLAEEYSWCDPTLCPDGVRHIACRTTGVSIQQINNILICTTYIKGY